MARDKLFKRSILQAKKGVNVGYQIAVKNLEKSIINCNKKAFLKELIK